MVGEKESAKTSGFWSYTCAVSYSSKPTSVSQYWPVDGPFDRLNAPNRKTPVKQRIITTREVD